MRLGSYEIRRRILPLIVLDCLFIAAFFVLLNSLASLKTSLDSQTLSSRWAADGGYGQVSVFLPETGALDMDEIYQIRNSMYVSLEDMGLQEDGEAAWIDAYSFETEFTVENGDQAVSARVTAAGGEFFRFQPVPLIAGSYFREEDSNDDLVILDETLAFRLFGSSSVIGMTVELDGKTFIISGVSRCENDFASRSVYGESPRMYMSYSAYKSLGQSETEDGANSVSGNHSGKGALTFYQVLMPELLRDYAYDMLTDIFEGLDKDSSIVANAERYDAAKLLGFSGKKDADWQGVVYPYWELAAQKTEEQAAQLLIICIVCMILPVITVIWLIVQLCSRRKKSAD